MNNKQSTTLNISLIPLFILISLIIGAGFFLLQGEIELPKFDRGPKVRRIEGFPTVIYTDKEIEKQREVISNKEDLNEFLNFIDETGLLTLRENINFNKENLLAVATETNDETGVRLKIDKIYEDKEDQILIVTLEERVQGENCDLENDPNVAVDIAAISKTDWKIKFERVKKTIICEEPEEIDESSEAIEE